MIQNKEQLIRNARTRALKKVRRDILFMLEHVLEAIDPFEAVNRNVKLEKRLNKDILNVMGTRFELSKFRNIYVVGGGKAVFNMAKAIEAILKDKITAGHVNVVKGKPNTLKYISYAEVGHPIPDRRGLEGTEKMLDLVKQATENDLVIALISGGGSACMPLPVDAISLQEKIQLTQLFLKTSAAIHEINTVRKHISKWKGGQLAKYAYPATLIGLYISDIVGDEFDVQASGPLSPDPTTFFDSINILKRKHIWNKTPASIKKYLLKGLHNKKLETPKLNNKVFEKVFNFTICNHGTSLMAVVESAGKLGYKPLPLTSLLEGEAREAATAIASIAKEIKLHDTPVKKPAVIAASGEIPVHVMGDGHGGRNQEAALSATLKLIQGITFVSFATDGVDGLTPKPVAGAIADEFTKKRADEKNLDIYRYLANNNSYGFFNKLGEHIITGVTGTNVGDLIVVVVI